MVPEDLAIMAKVYPSLFGWRDAVLELVQEISGHTEERSLSDDGFVFECL